MLFVAHGVRLLVLSPKRWRELAEIVVPRGGDPKAATIAVVQHRLPGIDLTPGRVQKPHEGLADAAGIAMAGQAWLAARRAA